MYSSRHLNRVKRVKIMDAAALSKRRLHAVRPRVTRCDMPHRLKDDLKSIVHQVLCDPVSQLIKGRFYTWASAGRHELLNLP
jgi:hypothetical protein